jgi:hypothetical protein
MKWLELGILGLLTAAAGLAGLLVTEVNWLRVTCALMLGLGAGIVFRALMR